MVGGAFKIKQHFFSPGLFPNYLVDQERPGVIASACFGGRIEQVDNPVVGFNKYGPCFYFPLLNGIAERGQTTLLQFSQQISEQVIGPFANAPRNLLGVVLPEQGKKGRGVGEFLHAPRGRLSLPEMSAGIRRIVLVNSFVGLVEVEQVRVATVGSERHGPKKAVFLWQPEMKNGAIPIAFQ